MSFEFQGVQPASGGLFEGLQKTARLPVLFVGHGSPMNAIEDNAFRRSWQALGSEFGVKYPRPQLILCISAHWLTRKGWWLTAMDAPPTLHDFGGFPRALFEQQYPAPGSPKAAQEISRAVPEIGLDAQGWGLDHGAWSVLKPMFPQADIPVVQLSMDYDRAPEAHYTLGQQLKGLRERGVLIVASGNLVHNLPAMQRNAQIDQAYDWAQEFDQRVAHEIEHGNLGVLSDVGQWGPLMDLAHPSQEHYWPLLYAAGAVELGEEMHFFNTSFQAASISMRSVVWGGC